jgi:hypothetical protein
LVLTDTTWYWQASIVHGATYGYVCPHMATYVLKIRKNRHRSIRSIQDNIHYPPLAPLVAETYQNEGFLVSSRLSGNREAKSIYGHGL